jgi:hypothetical protein
MSDKPKPSVDDLIRLAEKMINTLNNQIAQVRESGGRLEKGMGEIADIRRRLTDLEQKLGIRRSAEFRDWDTVHDAPPMIM